jgi:hypothetical protein
MAITRISPPEGADQESLQLLLNNGDLKALRDAVDRLQFKDEESLLRYVFAVLTKTAARTLTVVNMEGKQQSFSPAEAMLKPASEQPSV